MARKMRNSRTGDVVLPDWLGSGQDLFGTIQIIKGKKIADGFLEMDFDFRFSDAFNYPIVFSIRSTDGDIEVFAISFRINGDINETTRAIEEKVIAPKVCKILTQMDFIRFFADVVQNNIDFALYLNKTPKKFQGIAKFPLDDDQRVILDDRLIMKIAAELDERSA
jgi:hypothetical protein